MKQFVRVRVVQANALDLSLFQFDTDLTFAAFFLNGDRTVYGRFGSRSDHRDAERDISLEGFKEAMAGALELHKGYPQNKSALSAKQSLPVKFKQPEEYPSLAGKFSATVDYATGKVGRTCIHCHQIGEAQHKIFRADKQAVPDEVLHPWPMPGTIGLALDAKAMAKVSGVASGSEAEKAGFKAGDEIVSLQGQPLLSIADVQWVLHHAKAPDQLEAVVRRGRKQEKLTLELDSSWRRRSEISWRSSTWDLRRISFGGLVLKNLTDEERTAARLAATVLGLRVDHVGQYGEHAVAKKAGFQKNDIITSFDGITEARTESDLLRHVLQNRFSGTRLPVTVQRKGSSVEMVLPVQ